jgi:RNA polymerase sigma-70 factor (ECF subfamily)
MASEIGTSSTSSSLIRGLKADDPEAWRRMSVVYGPLVYSWCRRTGLSGADVADVAQDVFLSVYRSIKGFRRERPGDTFCGWLWQITRNAVLSHFRRQASEPAGVGGSEARLRTEQIPAFFAPNEPPVELGSQGLIIRQALSVLRPEFEERTWKAFWRTAVDGQSSSAVGEELGMSGGAVRNAKYRVLGRLREFLDEAWPTA